MPSTARSFLRRHRECLAIAAACLALIAGIWLLTLERVRYEERQAIDDAMRNNANLALALEEQTVRTIKQAEQALLFMKFEYERDGSVVTLGRLIEAGVIDAEAFASLSIVDAQGNVILTNGKRSTVSLADRDFFAFHRDDPSAGTRIGVPLTGRMTGRPVITLSRRASHPDGDFGGLYILGIDPNHFLKGYERFDLGRNGLINLVGRDGISRARRYGDKMSFGDDMRGSSVLREVELAPNGSFTTTARLDGVQRYVSYRALSDYPLLVAVGTSVDETLAEVRAEAREYYLVASGTSLIIALLGGALALAILRRERATRQLKASEAVHRATFEQAAVGVAHTGLDGAFLRINRRCCEILGYSEAELLARKFADVTHPDDRARSAAAAAGLLASHESAEFEKRYVRKDGTVLSALVSISAVRSPDGKPQYFVTVIQDITDKRRTELALRESERRFHDMLGRVELVSLMLDREARVTYCNDYLLGLTGWRREEVLGHNWFDLFIPAEEAGLKDVFARLLRDLPDSTHHENEILTRDGGRRMIRWNNAVLRSTSGEVIGTASLGEDITDRKRAEARLLEQLDELRRFQKVTVDRELRMIELEAKLRSLQERAAA